MSAPERGLSRSAFILIGAVALGGLAAAAARVPAALGWTGKSFAEFLALAAVIATSEQFWIELPHGTERENFSLTDAFFAASLLLLRPSVFVLGVAVGAVVGQAFRGVAAHKLAFNVGQFLLGITLAEVVYRALHGSGGFGAAAWVAAAGGMAAYFVVNVTTVALVISLVGREPFGSVLFPSLALSALHWLGNVALGTLAAVVWRRESAALPLLVVPLVLSYLAYRGWLRTVRERNRMHEMARAADAISAEGDLARRIPEVGRGDEVTALATTLNRMLERLEGSFRRERRFISEASHELRTPITICRGQLEVLQPEATEAELAETIEIVVDELARMGRIVDDMTTLARSEDPAFLRPEPVPINRFLLELGAKAAPLVDGRLRLGTVPEDAVARADPQRLTQALVNLLQNAAVHGRGDGPIEVRVVREPGAWRFEVADRGGGVPPGQEETVFRPFHRLDASRPGTGLGLAIVRGIAEAHGGSAGVESRPGEGATFWIRIPA